MWFLKTFKFSKSAWSGQIYLQTFAIEMHKVSKDIEPKIFADFFSSNSRENYDLHHQGIIIPWRYQSEFNKPLTKSLFNGTESTYIWFRGSEI